MPYVWTKTMPKRLTALMGATALGLTSTLTPTLPLAQDGSNGFTIRVNGDALVEDARVPNLARRVDVALAQADVQVVFDGLGAAPRLDLEIVGDPRAFAPGDNVTLQSALNYPAYVARGELRLVDLGSNVGARTLGVVPILPNGQVQVTVPVGRDIHVIHRVYDADGRYDETYPIPLSRVDARIRIDGVEDGANTMARSRIPVHGGAITVSGRDVAPGALVRALGENIRPDPSGGFVIQRIVPAGEYDVDVAVNGPGQRPLNETRRVAVPASEWFYAGIADLTYGARRDRNTGDFNTYDSGRFAVYVDGRTDSGLAVTGSLDTGEGPLNEIFRDLDKKDPASVLQRLDPQDLYPTYGDDSTIVDNTPTDGKIYLRLERQGNFLLWGNFESQLTGNDYVRNERTLYGFQGHYASRDTRSNGQSVASVDLYAAQPDRLPQRDVFLGTGGSLYFLERQDIGRGSETISVQLRDPVTGRVLGSKALTAGVDYDINYIQGVVTLVRPLHSSVMDATSLITDTQTDADVQLIVQYEYAPTSGDVDTFSYGGRAEVWASDTLRLGVSGLSENIGLDTQTLIGADLRYQLSDNTWVQLDYAESDGPGFGSTFSADGGLVVETLNPVAGKGTALKVEGQAELAELGFAGQGQISGYFERREAGFSNLDYTVDSRTGDEDLWGLSVSGTAGAQLTYGASVDVYENAAGERENTAAFEANYQVNDQFDVALGMTMLDRANGTETGTRADLGARLTYAVSEMTSLYAYGQKSLRQDGLDRNDRYGIGADLTWANGWSLAADISDGDQGRGARLLAGYDDGQGNTYYAGYELEAGRELSGITPNGKDRGRFVLGGQRVLSAETRIYGENTYDVFGRHRTLTSAYGLSYAPTEAAQYAVTFEMGAINDGDRYAFDRYAVSLGASYEDDKMSASGRLEYRTEDGTLNGADLSSDSYLLASDLRYKISDNARIVAGLDFAVTRTDQSALLDGEYGDVVLGYAYRPIDNDKLNILARYRYLHDMFGQRVDGVDENGPRQRSHVLSVNALYDLNPHWSFGTKLGYRSAQTAADQDASFIKNDAYLLAGSLTYHLVHEWDALVELRNFTTVQGGTSETGLLIAGYRHFGDNIKLGVGYNTGTFSDDLTDLVQDDEGVFVNLVAKF